MKKASQKVQKTSKSDGGKKSVVKTISTSGKCTKSGDTEDNSNANPIVSDVSAVSSIRDRYTYRKILICFCYVKYEYRILCLYCYMIFQILYCLSSPVEKISETSASGFPDKSSAKPIVSDVSSIHDRYTYRKILFCFCYVKYEYGIFCSYCCMIFQILYCLSSPDEKIAKTSASGFASGSDGEIDNEIFTSGISVKSGIPVVSNVSTVSSMEEKYVYTICGICRHYSVFLSFSCSSSGECCIIIFKFSVV